MVSEILSKISNLLSSTVKVMYTLINCYIQEILMYLTRKN